MERDIENKRIYTGKNRSQRTVTGQMGLFAIDASRGHMGLWPSWRWRSGIVRLRHEWRSSGRRKYERRELFTDYRRERRGTALWLPRGRRSDAEWR